MIKIPKVATIPKDCILDVYTEVKVEWCRGVVLGVESFDLGSKGIMHVHRIVLTHQILPCKEQDGTSFYIYKKIPMRVVEKCYKSIETFEGFCESPM